MTLRKALYRIFWKPPSALNHHNIKKYKIHRCSMNENEIICDEESYDKQKRDELVV